MFACRSVVSAFDSLHVMEHSTAHAVNIVLSAEPGLLHAYSRAALVEYVLDRNTLVVHDLAHDLEFEQNNLLETDIHTESLACEIHTVLLMSWLLL